MEVAELRWSRALHQLSLDISEQDFRFFGIFFCLSEHGGVNLSLAMSMS